MKKHMRIALMAATFWAAMFPVSCSKTGTQAALLPELSADYSHTITLEEAEAQLMDILRQMEGPDTKAGNTRIVSRYSTGSPIPTKADGDVEPFVHVFNFEDEGGFALMSGDDRVEPLIALTTQGELTPQTEVDNPGVIMFLSNMEALYLNSLDPQPGQPNKPILGDSTVYGPWETIDHEMLYGPCIVEWEQGYPYNQYCPTNSQGQTTYTGCVATAVAQLMSIYEYPAVCMWGTYNWTEMKRHINNYLSYSYAPAQPTIAQLMYTLGLEANLNMQYGINGQGSGAYIEDVPHTLENYGYTSGGQCNPYNSSQVIYELRQGYPVLMNGYDTKTITKKKILGITISTTTSYTGGHCWLLHGLLERKRNVQTYNSSLDLLIDESETCHSYPLCNFGYGGAWDGYYLSSAFDASSGSPIYPWDNPATKGTTTEVFGTDDYYQFCLNAITGIRQ